MRSIVYFLFLLLISPVLFATTNSYLSKFNLKNAYIPLQLGGFWADQGKSQNIGINGLIGDRFNVTDYDDENVLIGFGYYIEGYNTSWAHVLFGLNAFYFAPTEVQGIVTQEQLFNNLSFKYNIIQYPLYVATKVLFPNSFSVITFDLGIGANFILTSDLHESSLDNGMTIPDNIFKGTSSTAFSANVGLGLQFNTKLPIECGYRFFYLGQGYLNKTNGQILDDLNTGKSYANAIVCSVSV